MDHMLPSQAEDLIDNIGDESFNNTETPRTNRRSIQNTKRVFQQVKPDLQKSTIRQQQFHEVIPNHTHGLIANYEQSAVANKNLASLRKHNHIANPPGAGALANRQRTSIRAAAI